MEVKIKRSAKRLNKSVKHLTFFKIGRYLIIYSSFKKDTKNMNFGVTH